METISKSEASSLGLKRYFTGLKCIRGHISERLISNMSCLECCAENGKRYRLMYPEKYKKKAIIHREKNKEYIKEKIAEYRKENADRIIAQAAEYREANREKRRLESRLWQKKNPEKARESNRNRRAAKKGAEGTHTEKELLDLFYKQKGRCASCEEKIFAEVGKRFHADHINPLSKGGSNLISNIQLLCESCNCKKGSKDPIEWANSNGKIL